MVGAGWSGKNDSTGDRTHDHPKKSPPMCHVTLDALPPNSLSFHPALIFSAKRSDAIARIRSLLMGDFHEKFAIMVTDFHDLMTDFHNYE